MSATARRPRRGHVIRRDPFAADVPPAVGDLEFDGLLPPQWRQQSAMHFTPALVAQRAATLLAIRPGAQVLDVGAAVGKFCVVAAATVPDATFFGIERRRHLVRVANTIARRLQIHNVAFLYGDATEVDWSVFDAFYFFNPFAEHLRNPVIVLDDTLELDPGYFTFYVRFVREQLALARVGTRVVTYHGFGGEAPDGYDLARTEEIGSDRLELWIKTAASRRRTRRAPPRRACRAAS